MFRNINILFIALALFLAAGCGEPDPAETCATICEKLGTCDGSDAAEVAACKSDCERETSESSECLDAAAGFADCVGGRTCEAIVSDCLDEVSRVDNACNM